MSLQQACQLASSSCTTNWPQLAKTLMSDSISLASYLREYTVGSTTPLTLRGVLQGKLKACISFPRMLFNCERCHRQGLWALLNIKLAQNFTCVETASIMVIQESRKLSLELNFRLSDLHLTLTMREIASTKALALNCLTIDAYFIQTAPGRST